MGVLSFAQRRFIALTTNIVLVGPDCSGKSTLAEKLAKYMDMPLIKGMRIPDRMEMTSDVLKELYWGSPHNTGSGVIKDRWQFPDDIIYEIAHGRTDSPLRDLVPLLTYICNEQNVLFIYVTAHPDELSRRFQSRGDDLIDEAGILRAARIYEVFFNEHRDLPVIKVDSTNLNPDELLDEVGRLLVNYIDVREKMEQ